ncbi:alpha/beta-hydrolase [Nadsonia fulvescens var. elongata DSM 6958]|uniref:Alpha/beta-hydrolase n=1 Tax=Nadsonia fulvescens var. elongata DSM 6958 TaxID=857566 RepID=A0A1E3PRU9_9ASCO|nr:alpha/beta-hydrolase [Nadsonia fulvescens var. elongata DSM 6958]
MGVLKIVMEAGLIVVVALSAGIYYFQGSLVYPSNMPPGARTHVEIPPQYDMPIFEDLKLKTADGETIRAYVVIHQETANGASNYLHNVTDATKKKTVLVCCPNAGNIGHALPLVQYIYQELGYNVVIFQYRGYGLSTGIANEKGIKLDAECILEYIKNHPVLSQTSIIVYGRSLGGAVALYLCSLPGASDLLGGCIVENTFRSIPKLLPYVFPILGPFKFFCREIWDSEALMPLIPSNIPMLFLNGGRDEIVDPKHMETLYALSTATVKEWKRWPKGTHNDTILMKGYWKLFKKFIQSSVEPIEPLVGFTNYTSFSDSE